jgi:hypothetical protein
MTANCLAFSARWEERLRRRRVFLYLRLLLVGFGFVSTAAQAASRGDWLGARPPIRLVDIPVCFVFGIVAILFVIGIQAVNPWSAKVWLRSSWPANPLSLRQPCQFFHLGAWYFMASGLGALIGRLVSHQAVNADVPLFFAVGLGMRIGLSLVEVVFRRKFVGNPF